VKDGMRGGDWKKGRIALSDDRRGGICLVVKMKGIGDEWIRKIEDGPRIPSDKKKK
jgi:hypothetical protein